MNQVQNVNYHWCVKKMETSYSVTDHSEKNGGKRKGVFLTHTVLAVIVTVVLVVLVALVLLAAFLGPGRARSCSEARDDKQTSTDKRAFCRLQVTRVFTKIFSCSYISIAL